MNDAAYTELCEEMHAADVARDKAVAEAPRQYRLSLRDDLFGTPMTSPVLDDLRHAVQVQRSMERSGRARAHIEECVLGHWRAMAYSEWKDVTGTATQKVG